MEHSENQLLDPETSQPIVSERVLVNGNETQLTLTGDGFLRWTDGGQRCLIVEKEVLGFAADGPKIRIRTIVNVRECGIWCIEGSVALVRKDFVFQPLSEDSLRLWCENLRECIGSLGKFRAFFRFLFRSGMFCLGDGKMQGWKGKGKENFGKLCAFSV